VFFNAFFAGRRFERSEAVKFFIRAVATDERLRTLVDGLTPNAWVRDGT
jgi:hypothetical protein